ncbi:hypothetical protein [Halomonas denitrificans]|nr:hypothetical protein [Halomonas denitrificans]
MARTSAESDGRATPRMRDNYRDFTRGGFSMLNANGSPGDPARAE